MCHSAFDVKPPLMYAQTRRVLGNEHVNIFARKNESIAVPGVSGYCARITHVRLFAMLCAVSTCNDVENVIVFVVDLVSGRIVEVVSIKNPSTTLLHHPNSQ